MKLKIFLDGDNQINKTLDGIELLEEGDELFIYENVDAHKGIHFNEKCVNELMSKTAAKIHVLFIQNARNAVDFAIAINAAKVIAAAGNKDTAYVLISGDNDYNTIIRELRASFPEAYYLLKENSIRTAAERCWPLRVTTAEQLKEQLAKLIGDEAGADAYQNLFNILAPQQEEKERKWWQRKG